MNVRAARILYALAAAVAAAALVDPIVEGLSNAGLFGMRTFTDRSTADVVPILAIAVFLAIVVVGLRVAHLLRTAPCSAAPTRSRADAWRGFGAGVATIYPLQLATLYLAETLEQRLVLGHVLGGTVWLGGPVVVSLALHFAGAIVVAALLARLLAATTRRIAAAVRALAGAFACRSYGKPVTRCRRARFALPAAPAFTRLYGRAPPIPLG